MFVSLQLCLWYATERLTPQLAILILCWTNYILTYTVTCPSTFKAKQAKYIIHILYSQNKYSRLFKGDQEIHSSIQDTYRSAWNFRHILENEHSSARAFRTRCSVWFYWMEQGGQHLNVSSNFKDGYGIAQTIRKLLRPLWHTVSNIII